MLDQVVSDYLIGQTETQKLIYQLVIKLITIYSLI